MHNDPDEWRGESRNQSAKSRRDSVNLAEAEASILIKHYAIYIESGICSPLLDVGSQIWGGFWLDRLLSDITMLAYITMLA